MVEIGTFLDSVVEEFYYRMLLIFEKFAGVEGHIYKKWLIAMVIAH